MESTAQFSTPEAYLASLPEARRADVTTLHTLIREMLPDLEPRMWGNIIGYGSYHYRYASGREGDWMPIGLSSRKQYISLYVCAADEHGYLAESWRDRLGKVKVGRSCITFRRLADLDLEATAELLRRGAALAATGRIAM